MKPISFIWKKTTSQHNLFGILKVKLYKRSCIVKELLEIRDLNLTLFFIKTYLKSFVFSFLLNALVSTPFNCKANYFLNIFSPSDDPELWRWAVSLQEALLCSPLKVCWDDSSLGDLPDHPSPTLQVEQPPHFSIPKDSTRACFIML